VGTASSARRLMQPVNRSCPVESPERARWLQPFEEGVRRSTEFDVVARHGPMNVVQRRTNLEARFQRDGKQTQAACNRHASERTSTQRSSCTSRAAATRVIVITELDRDVRVMNFEEIRHFGEQFATPASPSRFVATTTS